MLKNDTAAVRMVPQIISTHTNVNDQPFINAKYGFFDRHSKSTFCLEVTSLWMAR